MKEDAKTEMKEHGYEEFDSNEKICLLHSLMD